MVGDQGAETLVGLLEDEDVPPEAIPDALRVPFAAYAFLDQIQQIILEHLDPAAAET